nr:hypothetical protein [Tanacetum cinerariifolium]
EKPLLKDLDGEDVDVHTYRSMISSLMYLTSSRLDIMFAVCACARFQVTPKALHLHAVKSIFRYLKGKPHLDFSWQCKKQTVVATSIAKAEYVAALTRKKVIITEATIRDALRLDDAESIDYLTNEKIFTELSRMGVAEVNVDDVPAAGVADEGAADVNADVVITAIDEPSIPSSTPPTQPPPPSQDLPFTSQVQPTPPPSLI